MEGLVPEVLLREGTGDHGSDVRCPRDPTPEVNEDEAPGSTGRY